MTTKGHRPIKTRVKRSSRGERRDVSPERSSAWLLREAKARFSEVINRVHEEGPQRVSVRGKKEVVIVTADEFRRMKGDVSGKTLVDALAKSPLRDVEFERLSLQLPVRDVEL